MNRIDFTKYDSFPLSTETMVFLQDIITLSARIASLGGNSYILSGCDESPSGAVSPGYLVVNGEILPFDGASSAGSHIIIKEEKDSVRVYDQTFADVYIRRKAMFGVGPGQIPWSSFKKFPDIFQLKNSLDALSVIVNTHVSNHQVDWANVTNKPSTYTPSPHSHSWDNITNKPLAYVPAEHTHPGMAVYLGEFSADGTVRIKIAGSIDVYVEKISTGKYKLTHNLGHTRYIILGVGVITIGQTISLRSMIEIKDNYAVVGLSDDASLNDGPIRFTIITF